MNTSPLHESHSPPLPLEVGHSEQLDKHHTQTHTAGRQWTLETPLQDSRLSSPLTHRISLSALFGFVSQFQKQYHTSPCFT